MPTLKETVTEIKKSQWPYYVYVLLKPDGKPFYIGKGLRRGKKDERISWHEWEANSTKEHPFRNRLKINTIKKIWREGGHVSYQVDSWHASEASVFDRERSLIAFHGKKIDGTGSLTNLTEGGDGPTLPEHSRQLISESLKKYYADHPEEQQLLVERGAAYFKDNPEAVDQARQNAIDNKSHEHIIKWLETEDPEVLAKKYAEHSEDMKHWYIDHPEEAKQMAHNRNRVLRSDEHRQKMSSRTSEFIKNNPEVYAESRQKAQVTVDKKTELRQECWRIMAELLFKEGKIKAMPVGQIPQPTAWKWKQKSLENVRTILDGPSGTVEDLELMLSKMKDVPC